jgi:signal transduction histidine kinase
MQGPRFPFQFRRHLFWTAGVFILLVLVTLGVVAHLIFADLSREVITRNLLNSLSELKRKATEEGHAAPEEEPAEPSNDLDPSIPLPPPPAILQAPPQPQRYRRTIRGYAEILTYKDANGRVIGRAQVSRMVSRIEPIHEGERPPFHSPVEEEWDLGDNRKQKMLTLHEPVDPSGRTIAEVGIPQEQVEAYLQPMRRSLIQKTLVGAAATLAILGFGFAYVMRLMQRTRRLESEAQMAERRAQVATLAREMAHEIRNPLNAISMNLEMLEEEVASSRPVGGGSELDAYLKGIKGEIRRLRDLAENFLAYARSPQLNLDGRDLNRFLEEICTFVQPEADVRRVTLIRDFDPMLPTVEFDSALLRQAVFNILHNAQQVVPDRGTVWVRTRVAPGGEVRVSIRDDGPGMTREVLDHIFQPFYSNRQGGTGLGLPIARRAVEAHGGRIEVESEPGQGSTFHLILPRRQTSPATPAPSEPEAAWTARAEGADGLRPVR